MDTQEQAPQMSRDEAIGYIDMHLAADFIGQNGDGPPTRTVYMAISLALRDPERAQRLINALDRQFEAIDDGDSPFLPANTVKGDLDDFIEHASLLEADPYEAAAKAKRTFDESVPQLREAKAMLRALRECRFFALKASFLVYVNLLVTIGSDKGCVQTDGCLQIYRPSSLDKRPFSLPPKRRGAIIFSPALPRGSESRGGPTPS